MILDEIIKDKKLVFDIGSNVGAKAEIYLSYGVKVICVEPQKECLSCLYTKFKDKNVEIVPYALSSDGSVKKFRISNASTLSTFSDTFIERTSKERFKNYTWEDPINVETRTLDYLIDKYGIPDFCKIDVEGCEKEVLSGLSYPIPYLSFEYTPELHDVAQECLSLIDSLGGYVFNYSEGESLEFSDTVWRGKEDFDNYLISTKDSIIFGDIYAKIKG
jgi:FkbM family methyltransferase